MIRFRSMHPFPAPRSCFALVLLAVLAAPAFAGGADDERRDTVEARLLRILRDRGVLTEPEFHELAQLGARMRAEESITSVALEKEITELARRLEERAQESKKADDPGIKVSYKLGKGVTFAGGDAFKLTVGGRLSPRFTYLDTDGRNLSVPTASGTTGYTIDDRATFDVRRARVWLEGFAVDPNLEYKLQFDVATSSAGKLRDALLDYAIAPELHVRGGQMKRPFSRQNWTSSSAQQFVERIAVVEEFRSVAGGDRSVGAMLWGEVGEKKELEWYLGAFNGEGTLNGTPNSANPDPHGGGIGASNSSNDDSAGLEGVARLVFNPLGQPGYSETDLDRTPDPRVAFGLQYMFSPESRGNPLGIPAGMGGIPFGALPEYDVNTVGADVAFKYQGFFATGEAYYREVMPAGRLASTPGHFRTLTSTGWFAQAGYLFGSEKGKGVELAFRYGQIDFPNAASTASFTGPVSAPSGTPFAKLAGLTKLEDCTAAISWFGAGHALKIQGALTYRVRDRRGTSIDDEDLLFQVQAQVMF